MIMLPSEAGIETKYSNTTWLTIKNDYADLSFTQSIDARRTGARHLFDYSVTYARSNSVKGDISLRSITELPMQNMGGIFLVESVNCLIANRHLFARVSEKTMQDLKIAIYLQQSKELKELWIKRFNLQEKVEKNQLISSEKLKIV